MDCGVVVLVMILKNYGLIILLVYLRNIVKMSLEGIMVLGLVKMVEKLGFEIKVI